MDVQFPLYVRLDDGELIRIDSIDKILCELEAIDIENDEYLFWDAEGNGVRVVLTGKVGRFRNPKVAEVCATQNPMSFQVAAQEWANQLGVEVNNNETPQNVWDRLLQAQALLPRPKSFISKLSVLLVASVIALVAVILALWSYDVWDDRRHVVSVLADTPVYIGHGSAACGVSRLATAHKGTTLPVRRIRYWKNCATLDVTLSDGRNGHIVLGDGNVSVIPPLH